MSEFKQKKVFSDEGLKKEQDIDLEELTAQKAFSEEETFVPVKVKEEEIETEQELQLEHVIPPPPCRPPPPDPGPPRSAALGPA